MIIAFNVYPEDLSPKTYRTKPKMRQPKLPKVKKNVFNNYPLHWTKKMKTKWLAYKNRCKNLDREFTLDYNEFELFITNPCVYCGNAANISIDRIDSKIGYIKCNCQSCCKTCNIIKHYVKEDVFLQQVGKIAKFRQL